MITDKQIRNSHTALKTLPVKFILPVFLAMALFILTIYLFLIPQLEKNMMAEKRQGLQRLTESAWSALSLFSAQVDSGTLTIEQAKLKAVKHFEQLRYGPDHVDYFWINDMTPVMIMHPYRPDLVGTDVSGFKDPSGKLIFLEMVTIVQKKDAGFVDYLWQHQDDPDTIVPKISFVKGFIPWGWVIGTGIYVEDVRSEIRAVTNRATMVCSGILILFIIVSGYIVWQGVKAHRAQVLAMEQSRLKEKQLIQADKMTSLGILVAGVAHEVNNPVTSIMLNAPSLKKAWAEFAPILDNHFKQQADARVCNMPYSELDKRVQMMISSIGDSAGRIKKIITELKDFSRPTGRDMSQQVDVNAMVNKSIGLTRSLIKHSTHRFSTGLDPNLPQIFANERKLQQVVINLIVNACQALVHPDQAIAVSTKYIKASDMVHISVADTGPGIAAADIEKIKEPFFTTKRDEGGTGLGLSICEKIVNEHKGTLEFKSVPGKGVSATLALHREQPDENMNREK